MNVGFPVQAIVPDMSASALPEWVPCLQLGEIEDLTEQITRGRTTALDEMFRDEQAEFRYFAALGMKLHETQPGEPL